MDPCCNVGLMGRRDKLVSCTLSQKLIMPVSDSYVDWNYIVEQIKPSSFKQGANNWSRLREIIEIIPSDEHSEFLKLFVPLSLEALSRIPISTDNTSFRNTIVGCLRLLPAFGDPLKPYIDDLTKIALDVIKNDFDDNATESLQLFIDLHKVYRSALESYVSPYLDYILEIASSFPEILKQYVEEARQNPIVTTTKRSRPAKCSLRMLNDAPVMIVLLFQLHRRFIMEYIPKFVPLVISILEVDLERPQYGLPKIESLNLIGNEPLSSYRIVFNEFISCQVKVLSFLAYIARGFSATLKEYYSLIPAIIVRLLQRCPPEGAPARKELLVAIRHILSTEIRQAFVPHIEVLMDEHLLLGDGYTAFYVFRPAAYSMLADLVHHVRLELSHTQLEKGIELYSQVMHDPTLPNGIQTMSIKLLLNLVDVIVSDRFQVSFKQNYLMKILGTIVLKFEWMRKVVKELLGRKASGKTDTTNNESQFDPFFDDPLNARPIPTDYVALDTSRDNVRDLKFQLKTLISGLKSIFLALRSQNSNSETSPTQQHADKGKEHDNTLEEGRGTVSNKPGSILGGIEEELENFTAGLFKDGLGCFDLLHFTFPQSNSPYGADPIQSQTEAHSRRHPLAGSSIPTDDKELMDQFAYVFTLLEPGKFHDVMDANIDYLIDKTYQNVWLVAIPQYFLAISGVSKDFACILAKSLMSRIDELGTVGSSSAVIMRLFKLLFLAVSVYPEENEIVLQPILAEIILTCFKLYPRASVPMNFLLLLRSLFRSIGGGRFDSLYKEILPLLPTILDELTQLWPLHSSAFPRNSYNEFREIYIELCLTTPVRLSNLLPYLSYLMRPVALALRSSGDLLNQGLRTFELCLDNLTPDFLDPILEPVIDSILESLFTMLRSASQLLCHTAIRLLGKLGGRSRRPLVSSTRPSLKAQSSKLEFDADPDEIPQAIIASIDPFMLSSTAVIDTCSTVKITLSCSSLLLSAMQILSTPNADRNAQREAIYFLFNSLAWVIREYNVMECSELIEKRLAWIQTLDLNAYSAKDLWSHTMPSDAEVRRRGRDITLAKHIQKLSIVKKDDASGQPNISKGIFFAILYTLLNAFKYLRAEDFDLVRPILIQLLQFLALLYITKVEHLFVQCINFDMLAEMLIKFATRGSGDCPRQQMAWELVRTINDDYARKIPNKEVQFELRAFFLLADKIMATCFDSAIQPRIVACRLISRLCDFDLSIRFFLHHEVRFIRGILFVMKSLPTVIGQKYAEELTGIIFKVLKLSNRELRDDVAAISNHTSSTEDITSLDSKKTDSQSQGQIWIELRRQNLEQLLSMLVSELSNPNDLVRKSVKSCFQLLSDIQGCEVTDLLGPLKARICTPIFAKPLRALPVHVQIGYTDAITYCLSLRPPLIEVTEELLRLIDEAISLVESDDTAYPPGSFQPSMRSMHAALQSLRIVCVRLLSACLSDTDFQQQARLIPLRNQIVALFFRTLYSKQGELVEVARNALEQMIAQQHKLPTDVLQNGLRPVLQSLSEPKQLTVAGVDGLRRVFQLFSHFFKAEIGKKLVDHLQALVDHFAASKKNAPSPIMGDSTGTYTTESGWDLRVVPAIIDLFSIIPNCGALLMSELTLLVIKLETTVQRRSSSPFRAPLARLFELYPSEALKVLTDHSHEVEVVSLFSSLVIQSSCVKFFNEIAKSFGTIKDIILGSNTDLRLRRSYLNILKALYQRGGQSIKSSLSEHSEFILAVWNWNPQESDDFTFLCDFVIKSAYEVTMAFVMAFPNQIECAIAPLRATRLGYTFDAIELPKFYRDWLKRCTPLQQRSILLYWMSLYGKDHYRIVAKVTRMIALPLIAQASLNNEDAPIVVDDEVLRNAKQVMWLRDCQSCCGGSCVIAVEELQFTLLVLKLTHLEKTTLLREYDKVILDFLLNRLQSLDCSVRYAALFVLSKCLVQGLGKEISPILPSTTQALHVFKSLLKAPCADVRMILRQAFDILLPFFVSEESDLKDSAALLINEALTRDGYLLTLVLSLWQSIHQNSEALISMAPSLVTPLITSLIKCAPLALTTPESKSSPLEIAQTILQWSINLPSVSTLFSGSPYLVDHLINSIIRWLSSLPDYSEPSLFDRGLRLLSFFSEKGSQGTLISLMKKRPLKLQPLERLFCTTEGADDNVPMLTAGMRLLSKCIEVRGSILVESDVLQYTRWIRLSFDKVQSPKALSQFTSLLFSLFSRITPNSLSQLSDSSMSDSQAENISPPTNSITNLREMLENVIMENLMSFRNLSVMFCSLERCPASCIDTIMSRPAQQQTLEHLFHQFLRCLQKVVREHISESPDDQAMASRFPYPSLSTAESQGRNKQNQYSIMTIVLPGIEFGARYIGRRDFPRAQFLNCLQLLWEQSKSAEVLNALMNHYFKWTEEALPTEGTLSLKERMDLLLVPCRLLETNGSLPSNRLLLEKYFEIVYCIYTKPLYEKCELRRKLEGSFLHGLCFGLDTNWTSSGLAMNKKFSDILDLHVSSNLTLRLLHVIKTQRWSLIGSKYWIPAVLDFLLRTINPDPIHMKSELNEIFGSIWSLIQDNLYNNGRFHSSVASLLYVSPSNAHHFWKDLLISTWPYIGVDMQGAFEASCLCLMSSDEALNQTHCRPSVVMSFLDSLVGIALRHTTSIKIPGILLAYLAKLFGCWHTCLIYLEYRLERSQPDVVPANALSRDASWYEYVSVADRICQWLGEYDYGFATVRRSTFLHETNVSMSFEQLGLIPPAQKLYESAMAKCRAGTVPYNECEFSYWEDRWTHCGRTLQQWDLLTELARLDENPQLGLECLWRLADWSGAETLSAAYGLLKSNTTPSFRHKYFEAFLALSPGNSANPSVSAISSDRMGAFQNAIEESIILGLYEWRSLPNSPCPAHGNILHMFQMIVEIQESVALFSNLANGISGAMARPQVVSEIKSLLTAWRERLPNNCDEMELWSDILAWRQHVFSVINTAFAPLVSTVPVSTSTNENTGSSGSQHSGSNPTHPLAYRGYHEMAWLINRFAHVARKFGLFDVCLSFLNRIYALPNIEIQDAFLKLKEQTKCHMLHPTELPNALDVVNATNLNYFSSIQKAEFFALRATILSRLGMVDEANRVFAQAVQIDLNLGKGWAKWGQFNDQRFIQGNDFNYALNAMNCYLQAATLFKAHKSRRFLARILWLLTFDDGTSSLCKSFEMYNADLPTWYWICFIPQLLSSLCRHEQRQARLVLLKIAKSYPQALYLPIRTFYDECRINRSNSPMRGGHPETQAQAAYLSGLAANPVQGQASSTNLDIVDVGSASSQPAESSGATGTASQTIPSRKPPIDAGEEIFNILKTAHPLLALTLENMLEHIIHRLRATVDEDFYRVLTSLIGEVYQHAMTIYSNSSKSNQMNSIIESSLRRVQMLISNAPNLNSNYRSDFEADFFPQDVIDSDPELLLAKLFAWRLRIEPILRRHPRKLVLDGLSRVLAEFEYHRFDDIDVFGQYLLLKDGNQDFIKVVKFEPGVAVVRRHGVSFRRLVVRGSDGVAYPFVIQNPSGRQIKREERIIQLLRFVDRTIRRGILSRRRSLFINVPTMVSISSHVRMIVDDENYWTLEEVLQSHCENQGLATSDEIFMYFKEKLREASKTVSSPVVANNPAPSENNQRLGIETLNIRTEIFSDISGSLVPGTVLDKFITAMIPVISERWIFRREFTRHLALTLLVNFVFAVGHRFLHKHGFSMTNGIVFQNEVLPMVTASGQISLIEIVPFRYTPNLQYFVTSIGTEGPLICSIAAGARSSSKAESELTELLPLFIRDELLLWYLNYCAMHQQSGHEEAITNGPSSLGRVFIPGEVTENPFERLLSAGVDEKTFLSRVIQNCELVTKRLQALACIKEEEQALEQSVPLFQSILDLISSATNPQKLAQMDGHWHPWF